MKHETTCIIYVCTCKSVTTQDLLDLNDKLFEDKHVSPEEAKFLRDMNEKKEQCPCGSYSSVGCSQTGCPLFEETE